MNSIIVIKKAMLDKGITSSDLAKKIGISPTYLSKIINGHRAGYSARFKISQELDLTYEEMWDKWRT